MRAKIVQLVGLLIVAVCALVFFVLLVVYQGELVGAHSNESALLGVAFSFLGMFAGIAVFMIGRLMAWWKRRE